MESDRIREFFRSSEWQILRSRLGVRRGALVERLTQCSPDSLAERQAEIRELERFLPRPGERFSAFEAEALDWAKEQDGQRNAD